MVSRRPLLSFDPGSDVELGSTLGRVASVPGSDHTDDLAEVMVERTTWATHAQLIALCIALVVPVALIAFALLESWKTNPSGRSWLILGLGYYIGQVVQAIYIAFCHLRDRLFSIRIEIRRFCSSVLFDAVSDVIAAAAEGSGETCSWDTEAVQEHDDISGQYVVRLRFWSNTRPRSLRIWVAVGERRLPLLVQHDPGADVVGGCDSRPQSQAVLMISTRTSRRRCLED